MTRQGRRQRKLLRQVFKVTAGWLTLVGMMVPWWRGSWRGGGFYLPRPAAANSALTKTSQADWLAGKYEWNEVNVATSSGDLKLQLDLGSWDASGSADMGFYAYRRAPMVKVGRFVYMMRNRYYGQFMRYDLDSREWKEMAFLPHQIYEAADMTTDGSDYIYALATRYNTGSSQTYKHFLRYDIAADSWSYLADTPANVKGYTALAYVEGTTDYIYAIQGQDSYGFWRYNVSANSWESLQNSTAYCQGYGCDLVYDGSQYLYLSTQWYSPDRFYRYDTVGGTWSRMADAPINSAFLYGTSLVKVGDYIYTPRGNNTRTFYRYSISGNSWDTAADLPGNAYYASAVYDDDDNKIIVYGSPGSFYDYYPSTNSWSQGMGGPPAYSSYSSGNSMISDGAGSLYYIRGSNSTNIYKFDTSLGVGATWSSFTSLPASARAGAALAWDGTYLYASRGEAGTNFYRCNPSSCSWSSLTNFPITPSWGAAMAASGSASLWYSRGAGQTYFYRYDIAGNSWTQKTGPPEGVYRGSSMLQIGDYIYLLQGYNSGGLFRYSETEDAWTRMASLPVGSYYGGGATWDGDDYIYATVGGDTDIYSRQFYRYSISQNRWERVADTPEMVKRGAGIAYSGGKVYLAQGNYHYGFWKYTPADGSNTYVTSGSWYSPAYDLTYVSSWGTFSVGETTPTGTDVTYYSRTSANGNKWSDWAEISGGTISSAAARYIQIKISLSGDGSDTPTVSGFTINYTGDETAPVMTGLTVSGYSQAGGDSLSSEESYGHTSPYFTWSGVTDAASGVEGYYVYFGSNASADPATAGTYQYTTNYTVSWPMISGTTYYLRIKAKDEAGNVSSAATGFTYVYNGISPVSSISVDTQADWDDNEASRSGVYTGSSTWWNGAYQYRRQLTVTAGSEALTTSSVIKVDIDTAALETAGKVRADRKDWRVVYWDGTFWDEVARDYESATETLFNPVKGIGASQSDTNYYVYYGNADENTEAESASLSGQSTVLGFDGTDDYVNIPESSSLDLTNFTVGLWIYPTRTHSDWQPIITKENNGGGSRNYGMFIRNGNSRQVHYSFQDSNCSTYRSYDSTGLLTLNTWNHILMKYDGSQFTFYLNGSPETPRDIVSGVCQNNEPVKIGKDVSAFTPVQARMYGVRIYNRALSDAEVTTIYSGGDVSSGLVGYWKFDEGTGQTVADSSGNNNDGTLGVDSGSASDDPTWIPEIIASAGSEVEVSASLDTGLILEPRTEGSWAGYQLPSLPRALRFAYGAAAYADGALYVARGYNTATFYKLDLSTGTWTQLADTPGNMYRGSSLIYDGDDTIYASRGENSSAFYKYTISTDTWSDEGATDPSMTFYYGAVGVKAGDYIYYARGSNATEFLRYDFGNDSWSTLASAPYGVTYGSGLVWDGDDTLWLHNGGTGLSKYTISTNSWAANNQIALMPYEGGDAYSDLVYYNGYIYTFTHVNRGYSNDEREYVWRYSVADNRWEKVTANLEMGPIVGAVAYDGSRYAYIIQGYNTTDYGTRSLYRFDLQTHEFFPSTAPLGIDRYMIDNDGEYMYPQPYTSTSIESDEADTVYYLYGNNDEFKFKKYVISEGKWYALPPIPCWYQGGGMEYAEGYLWAACGNDSKQFFRYDAARENWEQMADTPDIVDDTGHQGLVYDGSDAMYLLRGNGSTTLYKYTISTDSWSTESDSIPAAVGWGGSIVFDGVGDLYVFRGSNTTSFYNYDIGTTTWSTLTSAPADVYYGGSSIYYDGRIYLMHGDGTTNFSVYDVATDTWLTGPSTLSEVYAGGAMTKGPGNTAYALQGYYDMVFWKFNLPSSSTSFVYEGSFTSKVYDLGNPYRFAGLEATVASPSATSINFETRTSTDSASWSSWTAAGNVKQIGTTFSYSINSTPERYFQFKVTLSSPESGQTPTISDVTVYYYNDETAPTNPSTLTVYNSGTGTTELTTATWYNYANPRFVWSGADDGTGSGVAGYYVYLGGDTSVDPLSGGSLQTGTTYVANLSEDGDYYFLVKTVDGAGNTAPSTWEAFHYKYDGTAPNAPGSVAADPRTYTAVNDFTMFWSAAKDVGTSSGVAGYYYKTGVGGTAALATDQLTTATTVENITAYQDGANTFYVKTVDVAGNVSDYSETSFYYNGSAPSAPTNLSVGVSYSTSNSFSFDWDEPLSYQGSIAEYRYSVNSLPTATNYTAVNTSSLTAGAYATVKGTNVLYVVAVDEAGNVNYDAYASVEFTADTSAPGIPQSPEAFDNSIRATKQYKVGLTWDPPASLGTGFAGYAIYASATETSCNSTASNFTLAGTTAGTTYVVANIGGTALSSQTYYFCIRAYDSTNQYSAASSTVSLLPTGRWLVAPDLSSEPSASVKTRSATVSWSTSRGANSFVQYGTSSGDYGNEVGSSTQVTAHSVAITGLDPGTTYYYKVLWTDEDGNQGISSEYSFTTNPAPSVSNVVVKDIGLYSAYVTFTISNASGAELEYGKTISYGGAETISTSTSESTYTVKLDSLDEGTEYHFRIVGKDEEGNEYEGDDYSFETLPIPKISDVKIQQVAGLPTAALRILWKSNTEISSIVTYYPAEYAERAKDKIDLALKTEHELLITDLLDETDYAVVIKGKDVAGNEAVYETQRLKTATDIRPPKIINFSVETTISGVGEEARAAIIVSWDSDEPATTQVEYGEGTGSDYVSRTQEDSTLVANHVVTIPDLKPGQIYHLRAVSKDKANNKATSFDAVVITPKATKSALNLVIDNLSKTFGFLGGMELK